ncbi:MAG: carbon-nitrogen hydrolase family protein [Phyllobacterium sp.]
MMQIAVLQMQATAGNVHTNLERIDSAAQEAARGGASLLVTPELSLTGYGAGEALRRLAEPVDREQIRRLQVIARSAGIAIVAGFAESDRQDIYNSVVFVEGERTPVVYRKSHLYGDYERALFVSAPPSSSIVEYQGLRLGILICYDVEFPENVRRLALAGCDVILVPTAVPQGASGLFITEHMIRVRAFENQIFIAYANHAGADEMFSFAGRSQIAAPDGSLIAQCDDNAERLLFAEIDPDRFADSIRDNPYLEDLCRQGLSKKS